MKSKIKRIINEARIQRTIDPKIWASMSSASSRLRSTLGEDMKAASKDTKEVLLQKYVAGLLTMKVECPNNISDIERIKAYKNLGNAYINLGGSIKDIQKLFVENGGVLTQSDDVEIENEPDETQDYPDYDDIDISDEPKEEPADFPDYDEVQDEEPIEEPNDFPEYDDVETDDTLNNDYEEVEINELHVDDRYLMSIGKQFRGSDEEDYICWDNQEGFIISNEETENALFKCVVSSYFTRNKYPRYMFMCNKNVQLGNAGNNGKYDDFYFKARNLNSRSNVHIDIKPGSAYYNSEENNGREYTNILVKRNNKPAQVVKSLQGIDLSIFDNNPEMKDSVILGLKKFVYLPTLPELVAAIKYLPPGKYWTSSVYKNGESNIILTVTPDNVNITNDPNETANVVGFISFK